MRVNATGAARPLDDALKALQEVTGSPRRARKALLALLGERVLSERAEGDDEASLEFMSKRARHG